MIAQPLAVFGGILPARTLQLGLESGGKQSASAAASVQVQADAGQNHDHNNDIQTRDRRLHARPPSWISCVWIRHRSPASHPLSTACCAPPESRTRRRYSPD